MQLTRLSPIVGTFLPIFSAIITAATVLVSPTAIAQDSGPVIEEIIVTSRRIAESQQDVPIAVTAFSEAQIENMAPRTFRDFDGTVPNLFVSMNAASAQGGAIFIRGIGYPGTEKTQAPNVGMIVDGVPLGSNTGQLMDMFDVQTVEVNRGPQGVLFGKNTTGGSIVINRIAPQFNDWGFAVSGTYGDYDEQTFKGRLNIPLIDDTLALKIGYINKERDGYWDNITLGCSDCGNDVDYDAYTVALRWAPTDNLDAKLVYDKISDDSNLAPMDAMYSGQTPFITETNLDEKTEFDIDAWTLNVTWETGIGTVTSITGYRDSTDDILKDFDGTSGGAPVTPVVQLHGQRDQDFTQKSQELRLSGSFTDNISFTTGVYYYESDHDFQQDSATIVQIPNPAFPVPCVLLGLSPNPVLGDGLCQIGPTTDRHVASEDVESLGVFGSVTWQATDGLELSFGARYIDEEKEFKNAFFETTDPDNILVGSTLDDDHSWDDVIIKATAAYRFNEQVMTYASFSQGYLSGGYSLRGVQEKFATYEPENVDSYELGVKSDLWDNRVRLNVTAFYTEQDDKQFISIIGAPPGITFPTTDTVVNNLPETEIKGVEMELTIAITDNFSVNLIGGIQDGESNSFTIDGERIGVGPGPFEADDSDLAFFPEWNWAITPTFEAEIGPGRFVASATYKDQDEYIIGVSSLDFSSDYEDGYSRLDARVAYEWPMSNGDMLIISAFGKNLTDEEYREHQLDLAQPIPPGTDGWGFQGWAAPRTWAIEVQYRR